MNEKAIGELYKHSFRSKEQGLILIKRVIPVEIQHKRYNSLSQKLKTTRILDKYLPKDVIESMNRKGNDKYKLLINAVLDISEKERTLSAIKINDALFNIAKSNTVKENGSDFREIKNILDDSYSNSNNLTLTNFDDIFDKINNDILIDENFKNKFISSIKKYFEDNSDKNKYQVYYEITNKLNKKYHFIKEQTRQVV